MNKYESKAAVSPGRFPCVRAAAAAMSLASLLLAGCTTQLVTTPDAKPGPGQVSVGIPYALPMLQYAIALTWTIDECAASADVAKGTPPMTVTVSAAATEGVVPGEHRTIDPAALSSASKTSKLDVDFYEETGSIKSINASITDHGPEILTSVLTSVAGIARLALGIPSVPGMGGGGPAAAANFGCTANTLALIGGRDKAKGAVKAIPKQAQTIADQLAVLRTQAALGALTPADRKKIGELLADADKLAQDLATQNKSLAYFNDRLQWKTEWRFPTAPDQLKASHDLDAEGLAKWLNTFIEPGGKTYGVDDVGKLGVRAELFAKTVVPMCAAGDKSANCQPANKTNGLAFRQPVAAVFNICKVGTAECSKDADPIFTADAMAPQLGWLRVLPLKNGWGEDTSLSATFSKTGMLTKVGYEHKSAPAMKAAAAFSAGVNTALSFDKDNRANNAANDATAAANKTAAAKAEIDALQHQIDVETKKAELIDLKAALTDPAAADSKQQVDTLTAQLAILKLQKEVKETQAAIAKP